MVKVLGFDEGVAKKKTCKGCGAINQYYANEVKEYHGTDYGGGPDGSKWIDCGNCSKRITLESW